MRFTIEFRNNFSSNLCDRWEKYIQTVHPWEFDNIELYWNAWTEEEAEALKFIQERHPRNVIQKGDDFTIEFESIAGKRDFLPQYPRLTLSTASSYKGFPFPDRKFKDTDIRDPLLRNKLLSWAVKLYRLLHLKNVMCQMVDDILDIDEGVNTPGQLYRVWPEIASVMPQRYSGRVMKQKLASSLPPAFLDRYSIEEFRSQEYFDEVTTHFLAMSVLDCQFADTYPRFW